MIKAVIYDMDGILLDSEPFWQEAEINVFKTVGLELSHEDCKRTMGLRTDEVIKFWIPQMTKLDRTPVKLQEEIYAAVKDMIVERGKLLPGVQPSLEFFKSRNLPIGLATSSPHLLIDAVLDTFQIRSYFRVTTSANDEQFGKPHPAVYLTAARQLGVIPEYCLVFEDSFNGLLAAKAAKMKVVAIPDPHFIGDERFIIADKVLGSLEEVDESIMV